MFDGRDYHQAFEDACDELSGRKCDRDEVLGKLVGLEWTLWEAIRGAMIVAAVAAGLVAVAPISYIARQNGELNTVAGLMILGLWLALAVGLYWIFRVAVHYEISRHVKGRRFGDLDLPWLPGGTGYDPSKYPDQP